MEDADKVARLWQPLEWFLEGWHDTFDAPAAARAEAHTIEGMEDFFGPAMLQPEWIRQLESTQETSFPEVMHQITGILTFEISRSLLEGSDLDGCGNFLRGCAAYGIVTNHYFRRRTTLPGYSHFIERIRTQLFEAGARLAERELTSSKVTFPVKGQLIVMTSNGVEQRQELRRGQDSHLLISELDFPSPRSIILELGTSYQAAYLRAHDGLILEYQIGLGNFFALGCSSTGRFNPFGLGVEELWRSQRYFPLIGSLAAPTEEIENGLSWWRITNPQVAPLDVMVPSSRY